MILSWQVSPIELFLAGRGMLAITYRSQVDRLMSEPDRPCHSPQIRTVEWSKRPVRPCMQLNVIVGPFLSNWWTVGVPLLSNEIGGANQFQTCRRSSKLSWLCARKREPCHWRNLSTPGWTRSNWHPRPQTPISRDSKSRCDKRLSERSSRSRGCRSMHSLAPTLGVRKPANEGAVHQST